MVKYVKSIFSEYYQDTITGIFSNLISGSILHVDETSFSLGKEKCFVWEFTNFDSVKERLSPFNGVLISDFYAGYDSLTCPKQRCLIHLIRDINDDLVKNQQNEEFKLLTSRFSEILNNIILTVNRFGLKMRYLAKHKKSVTSFLKFVASTEFDTEICKSWQKRFHTFKNELFTFMNYNGVPWNNNNAEDAIKAIAIYRRDVDGLPTQKSIQEYLTLLSINQTCKYRGINFFEFLISGEKSIFEYSKKRTNE